MTLHLITDRRRLAPSSGDRAAIDCLMRQAGCAIEAGVDVIQIRERDLEAGQLSRLTSSVVRLAEGARTRVVVNDRLDVAVSSGAHGVHLAVRSLPVSAARRLAPDGFLIGRSVHDALELESAVGADYVLAGTVWRSESKPADRQWLGLEGLRALADAAPMPVIAIGGVSSERLADVATAGAAGAAGIGLFIGVTGDDCRAMPLVDIVRLARQRYDMVRSRILPS